MPNPYLNHRVEIGRVDLERRVELGKIALQNDNKNSVYIPAVYCVNYVLQKGRLGLSQASFDSIVNNIQMVKQGQRSETTASLVETMFFARDAVNSMRRGNFGMAMINAAGSALNLVGGTLYSANYDRMRLPAHQRHFYDMFDFIHC
ncbi:hypothetical protein [Ewingella americana]|jgi:hypothetical protein|uniref:hypothetical protein n=1 Tax=Ewingella americana TaxID=41202 RepID=UPI001128AB86|nr:hypothetical protein [Ewingella americana]